MSERSLSANGQTWQDWVNEFAIENAIPHWGQEGGSTLRVKHLDNWYVEPALDWNNPATVEDYWRTHRTDKIICFSKICFAAANGKLPPVTTTADTQTDAEKKISNAVDLFNGSLTDDQNKANGNSITGGITTNTANLIFDTENALGDLIKFALLVVGGWYAFKVLRGVAS